MHQNIENFQNPSLYLLATYWSLEPVVESDDLKFYFSNLATAKFSTKMLWMCRNHILQVEKVQKFAQKENTSHNPIRKLTKCPCIFAPPKLKEIRKTSSQNLKNTFICCSVVIKVRRWFVELQVVFLWHSKSF